MKESCAGHCQALEWLVFVECLLHTSAPRRTLCHLTWGGTETSEDMGTGGWQGAVASCRARRTI